MKQPQPTDVSDSYHARDANAGTETTVSKRAFLKRVGAGGLLTVSGGIVGTTGVHADDDQNDDGREVTIDYEDFYDPRYAHNGLENCYTLDGDGGGTFELTTEHCHSGCASQVHSYGSASRTSNCQVWVSDISKQSQIESLYSEFYVYFPEDFVIQGNGTHRFYWPGYRSGPCASGTTCQPSGDDGWSIVTSIAGPSRGTSANNPPEEYELRVGLYHMDAMSDPNPTGGSLSTGQWTKLGYYFDLNSYEGAGGPARDGVVRAWIDGEFVWERANIAFVNGPGEGMTHNGMLGYRVDNNELVGKQWYYDDHTYYLGGAIPEFARVGADDPNA